MVEVLDEGSDAAASPEAVGRGKTRSRRPCVSTLQRKSEVAGVHVAVYTHFKNF